MHKWQISTQIVLNIVVRVTQTEITGRECCTFTRMTEIKNTNIIKYCENVEQLPLSFIAGRDAKGSLQKTIWCFYKIKHTLSI
jgi:hypothetical protein